MAVDAAGRRQEGVRGITPSEMAGSRGKDGTAVNLPLATNTNPGPTEHLRGIEPNTGKAEGANVGDPMIQVDVAGEAPPRGEVFMAPDASGIVEFGGGVGDVGT